MIKVAAAVPQLSLAMPMVNAERSLVLIKEANDKGVNVVCFPQLSLTGCSVGELLCNNLLVDKAMQALQWLANRTIGLEVLAVVGLPLSYSGKLYNAVAFVKGGKIIGYKADSKPQLPWFENVVPDSFKQTASLYDHQSGENCLVSVAFPSELEDGVASGGIVLAPHSIPAKVGGMQQLKRQTEQFSHRNRCSLVLASAGNGESSTDCWYPGVASITSGGTLQLMQTPFSGLAVANVDIMPLLSESKTTIESQPNWLNADPFMGSDLMGRAKEAFDIQCGALRTRMEHTGIKKLVIGVSGGLDSTLALLVSVCTLDQMGLCRTNLTGITMPGFGTTDRTYQNAVNMMKALRVEWREINIKEACLLHLRDIGHDIEVHDSAYENAQARERTQILMDVANDTGALVVGTGDLSELALGWCTYNGDHMSMYAVNSGVPKTAIQHIIRYVAQNLIDECARPYLYDVIDTPISPELLPGGTVTQKTEDIIGPYCLHDFFIWHFMVGRKTPRDILGLAKVAFANRYSAEEIKQWLVLFFKRFFGQQFKRSCMPDGPDVFGVSLSPRGGWSMPSDISSSLWIEELV